MLKAQRGLSSYRGEGSEASWLLRIAYRTFVDSRRGRREQPTDEVDEIDVDSAARTSRIVERDVRRALRSLSEIEGVAIAACFYEGLTHDEAAVALEMPPGGRRQRGVVVNVAARGETGAARGGSVHGTAVGACVVIDKKRPAEAGLWWSWTGSNRRPEACKATALPTELQPHAYSIAASFDVDQSL